MDKKEKILIIEADVTSGEGLSEALKTAGYETTLVTTGLEGMKLMFDTLPHLIFLDVILPDMEGYQVLQKKQSEPLLAKIPLYLMSAKGMPIDMRSVPQGSVTDFLMALHANPLDIVAKVDTLFGHASAQSSAAPAVDKKKILWVEDDKLIGTILAKKIMSSGFELFHAKNGEEALDILTRENPDAIVVDLLLPGMSGFDILQKIQMDASKKRIPTMVLSNLSKPSDIEKAKMLGAHKFLVKAATSLDQIVTEMKDLCK